MRQLRQDRLAPEAFRTQMAARIKMVSDAWKHNKDFNYEYFSTLGAYAGRNETMPDWFEPINDLFSPNIAVLDYLSDINPRGQVVLDLACGLGNLLPHLKRLGFHCSFGYDSWSQLPRESAMHLLDYYGCAANTLSEQELMTLRPTILIAIGYWFESIMDSFLGETGNDLLSSCKLILVDRHYEPKAIEGFEQIEGYNHVVIYERRDHGKICRINDLQER